MSAGKPQPKHDSTTNRFYIVETTIEDIHSSIRAGDITCRQLIQLYLERIDAYDKPTGLNSIITMNPDALRRADELDEEYHQTGELRQLHGIPVIVKDNYDTKGMQTSAGSLALKGSTPPDDAYQVRALRLAGAIILAKSNMAERESALMAGDVNAAIEGILEAGEADIYVCDGHGGMRNILPEDLHEAATHVARARMVSSSTGA